MSVLDAYRACEIAIDVPPAEEREEEFTRKHFSKRCDSAAPLQTPHATSWQRARATAQLGRCRISRWATKREWLTGAHNDSAEYLHEPGEVGV